MDPLPILTNLGFWLLSIYATTFVCSSAFYLLMAYTPLSSILKFMMGLIFRADVMPQPMDRKNLENKFTLGRAYQLCTQPRDTKWFSTSDCCYRYFLSLLGFFWVLMTNPIAFPVYTAKYNLIWHGYLLGTLLTICYPFTPLALFVFVIYNKIKSLFVDDWMMSGPGRVFFVKPDGFIGSLIWDCYLSLSMFIGQFWLVGTHNDAV